MPFVTEEIWHKLPGTQGSIMVAPFPAADPGLTDLDAEAELTLAMDTITAIRNLRAEMNVATGAPVEIVAASEQSRPLEVLQRHAPAVTLMTRVQKLSFNPGGPPPEASAKAVVLAPGGGTVELVMPLAGLIDFREEERRLNREMDKLSRELAQVQTKLANEDFLAKAPAEVVARDQERLQALNDKMGKLKSHQKRLRALIG
jgi:valyl-tRNA synthetase